MWMIVILILALLPATSLKPNTEPENDPVPPTNTIIPSSPNQTDVSEFEQETRTLGTQTINSQRDTENLTIRGHTSTSMPGPTFDRIPEVPATVTETNLFTPDVVTVLFHKDNLKQNRKLLINSLPF